MNCSSDLNVFANSLPSTSNLKSFSRSLEQFFLTEAQNNFANKILLLNSLRLVIQNIFWNVKKKSFSVYVFEKYEIWMVEFARIIGFQLFCRFLKSTTIKLNTICFWQRKAKAPSGEFHFASYFSFRPFIYTQHYLYIHMWVLWKHIHIQRFNAIFLDGFFLWLSFINYIDKTGSHWTYLF